MITDKAKAKVRELFEANMPHYKIMQETGLKRQELQKLIALLRKEEQLREEKRVVAFADDLAKEKALRESWEPPIEKDPISSSEMPDYDEQAEKEATGWVEKDPTSPSETKTVEQDYPSEILMDYVSLPKRKFKAVPRKKKKTKKLRDPKEQEND